MNFRHSQIFQHPPRNASRDQSRQHRKLQISARKFPYESHTFVLLLNLALISSSTSWRGREYFERESCLRYVVISALPTPKTRSVSSLMLKGRVVWPLMSRFT